MILEEEDKGEGNQNGRTAGLHSSISEGEETKSNIRSES